MNPTNVYPGLNAAKGVLIILVIFTHSLPPGMLLYFNYLFHMPVFLAISGFLVKESTFDKGFTAYLKRLANRLLFPWIITSLMYLPFSLNGRSLAQLTVTDVLYPFYHLWYVPAYVIGVFFCFTIGRFKLPIYLLLGTTALFTVIWYLVFRENSLPVNEQPLYWLGDKRCYSYLFFFLLGFGIRNGRVRFKPNAALLVACIVTSFAAIVYLAYNHAGHVLESVLYMIFNTSLVLYLLIHAAPKKWLQRPLILQANKQSLGIYLYHPMIIFTVYQLLGDPEKEHTSNLQGFAVGFLTLAAVMLLVGLIQKWEFSNRYLLGMSKKGKERSLKAASAAA